jgi:thiol-disulfide isomerase/thioredoxin
MNMKNTLTLLGALFICASLYAQNTVKRTPVYEVFTSSTCPPCKPANDHLYPLFEARKDQIAVVKYQVSWPGTGDPYYTASGNNRRNYYNVNSAPDFYDNSIKTSYSSFSTDNIDEDLNEDVGMRMDLRFMVDAASKTVSIRARVEALQEYSAGAHRLMILINENVTENNKKTNGETQFHDVFKKMLPTSTGDFVIGALAPGDTLVYELDYTFNGDYRLPNNAGDPIDDETEHSVEDFNNLQVIMFMQSAESDKSIYQGAHGELSKSEEDFNRGWNSWATSINEVVEDKSFNVYPNPTNGQVNIQSENGVEVQAVEVYSLEGKLLLSKTMSNRSDNRFDASHLSNGLYILNIKTEEGIVSKQLSILK